MSLHYLIKKFVEHAIGAHRDYAALQAKLSGKSPREIFETIYNEKMWGGHFRLSQFHSGSGSHDARLVEPYVAAVRTYLATFAGDPVIVDIGCGDFSVGSQFVDRAARCIACDVVESLVNANRKRFRRPNLEFRVLDAIEDPLPPGDIALLRQVLQHLSNGHIAAIVPKLKQYRVVIVTEHLPSNPNFVPNLDAPSGLDTRLRNHSGVVLSAPPFNMTVTTSRIICEVPKHGGIIRTIAYEP
jgi:hypothetical protein